jgi:NAD(P)-dependent dehydrogenase (short-subunit alcohol dehydrogenase family)
VSARVEGSIALVTGGNRGIGRAFVEELVAGRAAKVYCGARTVADVPAELLAAGVIAVPLDVTDEASVVAASVTCADATVIINNAGLHGRDRLVVAENPDMARAEMEVNYFGVLNMIRAFAPVLAANGGGAIVNVLSVAGAIPTAFMGGYSPAKSAALFLSIIARAELEPQDTTVTALMVGSVDTRMADHVEGWKEDPRDIAIAGLAAMARNERIFDTDRMAIEARAKYALDPVRWERGMAKVMRSTAPPTTGRAGA